MVEEMKKLKKYLHDVKKEMKKVRWPNRKELFNYSLATIVFIVFFGVFFSLTDVLLAFVRTLGA